MRTVLGSITVTSYGVMGAMVLLAAIASPSYGEAENPFEKRTLEEWAAVHLAAYPVRDATEQASYEQVLCSFLDRCKEDMLPLWENNRLTDEQIEVLENYISLRDAWLHSESMGNFLLAGHITYVVDHIIAKDLADILEDRSDTPAKLVKLQRINSVRIEDVCDQFDRILHNSGSKHTSLREIAQNRSLLGRDPAWESYAAQFGVKYYTFEENTLLYLPVEKKSAYSDWLKDFESVPENFIKADRIGKGEDPGLLFPTMFLKSSSLVIRSDNPTFALVFWAQVTEFDDMISIALRSFEEAEKSDIESIQRGVTNRVVGHGPKGRRWLVFDYVKSDWAVVDSVRDVKLTSGFDRFYFQYLCPADWPSYWHKLLELTIEMPPK